MYGTLLLSLLPIKVTFLFPGYPDAENTKKAVPMVTLTSPTGTAFLLTASAVKDS